MSTKIYTGFVVKAQTTQAALAILGRARPGIQQLVNTKSQKDLARRLVTDIDTYTLLRHLWPNEPLPPQYQDAQSRSAWWHCLKEQQKAQETCRGGFQREPLVDCDVELTLYVQPDTGHLLGYIQEEHVGAYTHLMTMEGISEFGYWNNTDPAEGVSDEEWTERGAIWDNVVDTPDNTKFSMCWQPDHRASTLPLPFPTLQERANRHAKDHVSNQMLHEMQQPTFADANMSAIMRVMRQVDKQLQDESHELHAKWLETARRFEKILVPAIEDCLYTPLAQLPGLPAS